MIIVRKDVRGFKNAWLVKKGCNHFLLVAGENSQLGQTIVFKADSSGKIRDWKKERIFENIGFEETLKKFDEEI